MIKQKLLESGYLDDNIYLDQYCDLMESNLFTQKQKGKTNKHHVIPRCLSKLLNQPPDKLIVNLLFKDHVIAHCLLTLSAKETQFKYFNMCAVYKLLGLAKQEQRQMFIDLDIVQKAYECSRQQAVINNPMNNDVIKEKHDTIMRSDDVRNKISEAIINYRKQNPFSEEHKKKISEKAKNQIFINKDGQLKHVSKDKVNDYINLGWQIGSLPVPRDVVERRAKTREQPVQCIDKEMNVVQSFKSLTEACEWWVANGYPRKIPKDIYYLKNVIKQSAKKDKYIGEIKWVYLYKPRYGRR